MRKSVGGTGLVGKMITCDLLSESFNWNANCFSPLQAINNYYNAIMNVYIIKN